MDLVHDSTGKTTLRPPYAPQPLSRPGLAVAPRPSGLPRHQRQLYTISIVVA
jgi:hypothetical protein